MSTSAATKDRVHVSRSDAAERHGVSLWTIDELLRSGAVTGKVLGRRRLVNLASLDAYFDELEDV